VNVAEAYASQHHTSLDGTMRAQNQWQPRRFVRFNKALDTSVCTASILTDQGTAYIKAMGNRCGPHALASELLGTQLARWFGLQTFDFAIMEISEDDEIPFARGGAAQPGPAFLTREEQGTPWDGSAEGLGAIDNPQDISLLVVFDTWTLNCDRHPPDTESRRPNYDNVFLSSLPASPDRFLLKAMDHTHCFTCGREITNRVANIEQVRDERPYGLFPEFSSYLSVDLVRRASDRLGTITRPIIESFVATIPLEWEVDAGGRAALVELIYNRAFFVRENVLSIIGLET